jgi:predicted DNA-binding protein
MFSRYAIKLPPELYERAVAAAQKAGYSSVEEFVIHAMEKQLAGIEEAEAMDAVTRRLKGLGYLE